MPAAMVAIANRGTRGLAKQIMAKAFQVFFYSSPGYFNPLLKLNEFEG